MSGFAESPVRAEPYWRQVIDARSRVLGENHPDTLRAKRGLADLLKKIGRVPEAAALYGKAMAGHEDVLGSEHPATVRAARQRLMTEHGDS